MEMNDNYDMGSGSYIMRYSSTEVCLCDGYCVCLISGAKISTGVGLVSSSAY